MSEISSEDPDVSSCKSLAGCLVGSRWVALGRKDSPQPHPFAKDQVRMMRDDRVRYRAEYDKRDQKGI